MLRVYLLAAAAGLDRGGVFDAVHKLLLDQLRALGQLDLDVAVVDRAHVRALKGGSDGPLARRSGSPRLEAAPDHRGQRHPACGVCDWRQPARQHPAHPTGRAIPVIRGKRGRPRLRPRWLYGDRGYDYDHHRKTLREHINVRSRST
jgi:hypothetical protein